MCENIADAEYFGNGHNITFLEADASSICANAFAGKTNDQAAYIISSSKDRRQIKTHYVLLRLFFRTNDCQVHADLQADGFVADFDVCFAVQLPAQRSRGKFFDIDRHRSSVDRDFNRLCIVKKLSTRYGAR